MFSIQIVDTGTASSSNLEVSNSSSEDEIESDSDIEVDGFLCEQEVIEEGERELILVPQREVSLGCV